jgi:hypothetical protein
MSERRRRLSRFRGVTKDRGRRRPWCAQISFNCRTLKLGSFYTEIEAAIAYNTFVAYSGLDRPLNEIPEEDWGHD